MKKKQTKKKKSFLGWALLAVAVVLVIVFLAIPKPSPVDSTASLLPTEVSPGQVNAAWKEGSFILDVREQDEWNAGHISGATLIPLGVLTSRLGELPKDKPIYVVCRSGNRSAAARDALLDAGFASVTSMDGGMNDWVSQGFEIVTGP